jgi:hypothetical protein
MNSCVATLDLPNLLNSVADNNNNDSFDIFIQSQSTEIQISLNI